MKLYFRGRKGQFDAVADYSNGKFCVLQGSHVSKEYKDNLCSAAKAARLNLDLQEDKQLIIKPVLFKSASAAAQFVSGHMTNGLRAWKLENGSPLSTIEEGNRRKHKNVKWSSQRRLIVKSIDL